MSKKRLLAFGYFLGSLLLGALLAAGAAKVPFLAWLSQGYFVGISTESPMCLDLSVIKLSFGLEIGVTVAHIVCFAAAFIAYLFTVKRLGLNGRAAQEKRDEDDA